MKFPRAVVLSFSCCLLLIGCDSGGEPAADPAANAKSAEDAKREKILAEAKAKRDAEAKAEEEAEAARLASLDKIAVLPAEMPKKLEKACEARVQAEDDFMHKNFSGPAIDKWEGAKATQLGFAKKNCLEGSLEVAACEINAMNTAPPEHKKDLPDFLRICREKFGGGPPAGGPPAVPPKSK